MKVELWKCFILKLFEINNVFFIKAIQRMIILKKYKVNKTDLKQEPDIPDRGTWYWWYQLVGQPWHLFSECTIHGNHNIRHFLHLIHMLHHHHCQLLWNKIQIKEVSFDISVFSNICQFMTVSETIFKLSKLTENHSFQQQNWWLLQRCHILSELHPDGNDQLDHCWLKHDQDHSKKAGSNGPGNDKINMEIIEYGKIKYLKRCKK